MCTVNRNPVCVNSIDTYNNIKIWYVRSTFNLRRDVGIAVIYNIVQYIIIIVSLIRGRDSEIFSHLCPHHEYMM